MVPGSHKAAFARPPSLFNGGVTAELEDLPVGVVNVTPRAETVVMTEMLAHGTLQWKPIACAALWCCATGPNSRAKPRPPEVLYDRLSPQTIELMAPAHYTHVKEVVKEDVVRLA